jgi:ribosomal protection tetracycline resistance protein
VERVLSVLDGAVLVISAVEGVQPQTRVLMRALRRLRIPTLLFVNKLDRMGADFERVVREIAERLTPAIAVADDGEGLIEVLAANDDELLAAYVDGRLSEGRLRTALAAQSKQALVHPVLRGSAITGAGVEAVAAALGELLPSAAGDPDGPLSGTVFKIERGDGGEKIAYVRMFSGTLRTRDVVCDEKVTALAVFDHGGAVPRPAVSGRADREGMGAARRSGRRHDRRVATACSAP